MEPRPNPGRNPDGTFTTNDATTQQAIEALIQAVECLSFVTWMHKDQRAELESHIATAKAAVGLADAGERPEGAD
jgi:hypothetical protein